MKLWINGFLSVDFMYDFFEPEELIYTSDESIAETRGPVYSGRPVSVKLEIYYLDPSLDNTYSCIYQEGVFLCESQDKKPEDKLLERTPTLNLPQMFVFYVKVEQEMTGQFDINILQEGSNLLSTTCCRKVELLPNRVIFST